MRRTLLAAAAFAAVALPIAAQAAPEYPVVLVAEPGSCPPGYRDRGYVGPPGARWRICDHGPYECPPPACAVAVLP
ncbi:MAG: hypothetical protein QOE45_488 [Frankiaceae bacterium]|jgi:hypothetical protein|nr:hypothetical protein [Frankiaceae bacterium]